MSQMQNTMRAISTDILRLQRTSRTPEVVLDPQQKEFRIVGRSIPEDSVGFYQQVINWLERFRQMDQPADKLSLEVSLEYFNTSSSKCILDVFKQVNRIYTSGKPAEIIWMYDEDDEDLMEMGEDYGELLDLPFHLKGVEY